MICERRPTNRCGLVRAILAAVCIVASVAAATAAPRPDLRGYVDGDAFVELAGDDNLKVEVSVHSSLLKAVLRGLEPELQELLGGLESIHAIIVDLEDVPRLDEIRALIRSTRTRLEGRGWERLALVREEGSEITVLVLNDEVFIQGLVVMVVDRDDGQLVFANVAGRLDLAAIEGLQHTFGVPGLDRIDLSDTDADEEGER